MIIGILSDSHGNTKRTARAIDAIKAYRPDHVIHCGDIGSNAVLTELAAGFMEPEVRVTCVLGNVDHFSDELTSAWPHLEVAGRMARLEIGGKKIAVIHGDETGRLTGAMESGAYDYIFTGHTHARSDDRFNQTRIINPGALTRTHEPGCAVLDTDTDCLTYLDVG